MEPQGLRGTALVLAALAWLGLAGSEQASHFTTPVPPFPEALTAANREGKPLLLVFSASWCGPCKRLARDLRRPGAQATAALVRIVTYVGEGAALMQRYGLNSFPSLM